MVADKVINIIVSATVFGLVLSIWCIGVFLWMGRYLVKLKTVRRRLGISGQADENSETLRLWRDMQIRRESDSTLSNKIGVYKKLQNWIDDAGWKVPFRMVILMVCALAMLAFIVMYTIFSNVWLSLFGVAFVFFAFLRYIDKRILQRSNLFERQLVDALGVAARSLRAGHPLAGAFRLIAEEISEPIGPIFNSIHQQQAFGNDLRDALKNAAKENRNTEFKLFATAVTVQMQSGGNLADLMDTLVSVIRARIWLNKRVRVLTAQVQFSKMVLIAMPILLLFGLNIINPSYMEPLYTTHTGHILLMFVFVFLFLGAWLMNKMAKIDL